MAQYDTAISALDVDDFCADRRALGFLKHRKQELVRSLRGADSSVHKMLEEDRKRTQALINAKHVEMRKIDKEKAREADQRRQQEALEKAVAEERRLKRKKMDDIALGTDREWTVADFNSPERMTKEHEKHIREALERIRIRAPSLPDELQANWKHFLEVWPQKMRSEHGVKAGAVIINRISNVLQDLGRHALLNPALSSKRPRSKAAGDSEAFNNFLRQHMLAKPVHSGILVL